MKSEKHYQRAIALVLKHEHRSAIKEFLESLGYDPDYLPSLHDLASTHGVLNEWIKAEKYYKRVIELDPECHSAMYNLGSIFCMTDRLDEGLALCQQAVNISPSTANGYGVAATILGKMGRIREALQCDERAVQLAPKDEGLYSAYLMRLLYSEHHTPDQVAAAHIEYGRRFDNVSD